MKILLINPPVYLPTTFPFSLAAMKAELQNSLQESIEVLDLNAVYHYETFKTEYQKLQASKEDYYTQLEEFNRLAKSNYSNISKSAMKNQISNATTSSIKKIIEHKPDVLAISLTYNSQIFVTKQIINEIKKDCPNIKIVIGGPADYSKIMDGTINFADAKKFIEYLVSIGAKEKTTGKKNTISAIPDFTSFNKEHYFTKEIVYPIRTSKSCPYKQCTFCTHHENKTFEQYDLSTLRSTIQKNKIKKICFIDDDLTPIRLKQISEKLKDLNVTWWCQLRPIKQIQTVLKVAHDAGLKSVAWGLESGNQRILDLIKKGTNPTDIATTLTVAKNLGINNMIYTMFGFPTETEAEFVDTINFLEENKKSIDIVSPSVFGLQYGSKVMKYPNDFDVTDIKLDPRTFLSDKISYKTSSGLDQNTVKKLMKKYKHQLQKMNKLPRIISVFKEQVLNIK
ncbi:radical SAM protein [archaeon]|nr:radical SAM protein [archaeon]